MKFVIEHLSKSFEKKEVLRDIDFTFDEGKIYGLLGRNGAGKTTLFNCLNRDLKAGADPVCHRRNGQSAELCGADCFYPVYEPVLLDSLFDDLLSAPAL